MKVRRREWVRAAVSAERNKVVRMWMRVALAGERLVDVGGEEGYANGGGVYVALKRLRMKAAKDPSLQQKLDRLKHSLLSNVES